MQVTILADQEENQDYGKLKELKTMKTQQVNQSQEPSRSTVVISQAKALKDALAYVIINASANGASWSPDIISWAMDHRLNKDAHPRELSGGDLVRLAVGLPN